VSRRAVFLDRDGTIIRDAEYIRDPAEVKLLAGAAKAIRRLNDAALPVVVVTNQSGIARGYFTDGDYERVQERVEQLLAAKGEGARIDATYLCPHHPDFTGPCDCRKPGTLLFERAARDLDLSTRGSWYLGDRLRDVQPARELGGTGILVRSAATPADELATAAAEFEVAPSLDDAVSRIIESAR
jgi:D-glycero-D-manno-heptose 1,7-bisphosphate phosphatase